MQILAGMAEPAAIRAGVTGINKRMVAGPVPLRRLASDAIRDQVHHCGADQAVSLFTKPDHDWWRAELGRDLPPGSFGENLLIDGVAPADLHASDRLTMLAAVLKVASRRIPCETQNWRLGDRTVGKRFTQACRSGNYARVVVPGEVAAGDGMSLVPFAGEKVTRREVFNGYPYKTPTPEFVARCLAAPVHQKLRQQFRAMGYEVRT